MEDVKKVKEKIQPPFTTSTLQQKKRGRKLGFQAQWLWVLLNNFMKGFNVGKEGSVGLISYMRTDSTRISSRNSCRGQLSILPKIMGKIMQVKVMSTI